MMTSTRHSLYRQLPATDHLLRQSAFTPLLTRYGRNRLVAVLRQLQTEARLSIQDTGQLPAWSSNWQQQAADCLMRTQQTCLRPVFNLTGTVLHTNLGRALLASAAVDAVTRVMRTPVTLEYDLQRGERGHRDRPLAALLCQLTGAEDACIVNNNAAAVLLMLAATAAGKNVVISRGELVEIGGEFRIPDVMRQAGCQLLEVGTTNRTHAKDYQQAVDERTGAIMKVHTSNYQINGFTKAVDVAELAAISEALAVPLVMDLGSGALVDLSRYGLPKEPMPQQMIAAGVSLVCFSADKLCGGPQAGIIVGKKALIDKLQRHPLKRALRADKMTLAALEATLQLYLQPETLAGQLPTLRFLSRAPHSIHHQAQRVLPALAAHYAATFLVQLAACRSQIGSGSLPIDTLPTTAITFTPKSGRGGELTALAHRWRQLPVPVIGRIAHGKLWLDLRCLDDEAGLLEMLLS